MEVSTEIAIPEGVIVHPVSGEAKELAQLENSEIRIGIEELDALSRAVADAKQKLAKEAWERKNAGQAIEGVEVTQRRSWHTGDTGAALDKLIADGVVSQDRDMLLKPSTTFKPVARSLNSLADSLVQSGDLESAGVLLSARRDSVSAKVKA